MDDVLDGFPDTLAPGTHLLGTSPPMLSLQPLVDQYVARGLESGDGCVVVTTDQDAESVVAAIAERTTETELNRLGVVDATGQEPGDETLPCHLESVGSPADLTGIGIGLSKQLESLYDSDVAGYRVLVDSVASLLVYAGFERVYQFLHTVTNQIDKIGGSSVSLLTAGTGTEIGKFESIFDGVIETRETEAGFEYRLRGHGEPSEWRSLAEGTRPWSGASDSGIVAIGEREETRVEGVVEPALESPDSLQELIDAVDAAGMTLTLCNYDENDEIDDEITSYFDRHNVAVRTATLSTETPANVAILHRGSDVFATSSVSELYTAISVNTLDTEGNQMTVVHPDVLEHVHRNEYTVENGTKLEMVRISRLIEARALGAGRGTLHTGFQRLNRIDDELDTQDIYEGITATEVAVHLYGRAGEVPNAEEYTLHTAAEGELVDSWFVVYDGGGQDARKAALVCEETEPGHYTGFWTYSPAVVDVTVSYLETAYGDR